MNASQAMHYLAAGPVSRTINVDKGTWRYILLTYDAQVMSEGTIWDIKAQHLGVGVYKLRLVAR